MTVLMSFDEARRRAMFREMDRDPNIFIIGGDPSRRASLEYKTRFGDRMLEPPLSEFAYSSVAVGASMAGLRPFVSIHTSSFIFYGWPALVLEAANVRYSSGGKTCAPVVFSLIAGTRRGGGPQHQHTPHSMLQNIPGLRILAPGTPGELDSAIHSALTGYDPTILVEHSLLEGEGEVNDDPVPLQRAIALTSGNDAVVVTYSYMTTLALEAAKLLREDGLSIGVVSVPVLSPSPAEAILREVADYSSVLFVDESIAAGSPASYWMAHIAEQLPSIRVRLLCSKPVPGPAAPHLCDQVIPSTTEIVAALHEILPRS